MARDNDAPELGHTDSISSNENDNSKGNDKKKSKRPASMSGNGGGDGTRRWLRPGGFPAIRRCSDAQGSMMRC